MDELNKSVEMKTKKVQVVVWMDPVEYKQLSDEKKKVSMTWLGLIRLGINKLKDLE